MDWGREEKVWIIILIDRVAGSAGCVPLKWYIPIAILTFNYHFFVNSTVR